MQARSGFLKSTTWVSDPDVIRSLVSLAAEVVLIVKKATKANLQIFIFFSEVCQKTEDNQKLECRIYTTYRKKTPGKYRMTQREWFIEMTTKFKFKFLRQLQVCKFLGDKHTVTAVKFVSENCNLWKKCLMINFNIRTKFEPFWIICNVYSWVELKLNFMDKIWSLSQCDKIHWILTCLF